MNNANPQYILYQANVSSIEYQRMMSVYKKAVRQTEQIRWKIQKQKYKLQKYKIRSEYTEFNTYKMIDNICLHRHHGPESWVLLTKKL